jgi:glyoxylase-like metal-dependent hydrolase (beta-lactamase superfamily II)
MRSFVRAFMRVARSVFTFVILLSTLGTLAGCATSHTVSTLADGVSVHAFRRDYTNIFVVARGENFFMVDAGYEKDAPTLADDLRRAGFEPGKLRAIILTHGHHDHAGGSSWFRERFQTPIIAGTGDAPLLAAGAVIDPLCPTDAIARGRLEDDEAARFTSVVADRWVESELDLDAVTGVPGTITVLPGHTRGSLIITIPGAAFVGDLFRGSIVGSSAEVHFYMCDLGDNRADVRALLGQLAPKTTMFFPGHFGPVSRDAVAERFAGP